jgi:hypothetical protein
MTGAFTRPIRNPAEEKHMVDYPTLEQFVAGHLHQDWSLDYADEWHALSDFIDGQPDLVQPLARELEALLAKRLTEGELIKVLESHGADYIPRGTDDTARAWLEAVLADVSRHGGK